MYKIMTIRVIQRRNRSVTSASSSLLGIGLTFMDSSGVIGSMYQGGINIPSALACPGSLAAPSLGVEKSMTEIGMRGKW